VKKRIEHGRMRALALKPKKSEKCSVRNSRRRLLHLIESGKRGSGKAAKKWKGHTKVWVEPESSSPKTERVIELGTRPLVQRNHSKYKAPRSNGNEGGEKICRSAKDPETVHVLKRGTASRRQEVFEK